ncbi:hypothetical protein [Aquimarina sp. 2201CG5-10]|uniref:hypothetical protein n=1 Tax=Aquimarina callyspongiae TaxID=3098150 RepID=UPI002AB3D951|nr:hypothetical protein [Aquimarina sp. 2201CG5-10]MDY8137400.1 hypothetical protein [Aquimarina sp. 2201CG5-10]
MKRIIVFTIVFTSFFFCNGQKSNCTEIALYNLVFKDLELYQKKAVKIEVGYTPTKSVVDIIQRLDIYDTKNIVSFKNVLSTDYSDCNQLQEALKSILDQKKIKENGRYISYNFSSLITISESEKCILMNTAVRNKNHKGGKAIGDEVLFILKKELDTWKVTNKQSLGSY